MKTFKARLIAVVGMLFLMGQLQPAYAALLGNERLLIGEGSWWAYDLGDGSMLQTPIVGHEHLRLGAMQPASIGHLGTPNGTESPGIDQPSVFYSFTVLHQTTSPVAVLSSSGSTADLDFSGWEWVWHFYSHGTATGAWNGNPDGVAQLVCAIDCGEGDSYVLSYSGVWESNTGSGIGGERYQLHLEGTISAVPLPATLWLLLSGLGVLLGLIHRGR